MLGNCFLLDSSPHLLIGKQTTFILAENQQQIKHLLPLEAARHSVQTSGCLPWCANSRPSCLRLGHSDYVILSGRAVAIPLLVNNLCQLCELRGLV